MGHREIWGLDKSKWKKMCPCFPAGEEYKDIMKEHVDVPKPEQPITPKYEPKPIQIPTEPIVPEYKEEVIETSSSREEKKPKQRTSIVGSIVKLFSKLFSHG